MTESRTVELTDGERSWLLDLLYDRRSKLINHPEYIERRDEAWPMIEEWDALAHKLRCGDD